MRDKTVPVAVGADNMDDFQAPGPGFLSAKYPADGGDATGGGSWQTDATSSAAGSKHFRHSAPGSNYRPMQKPPVSFTHGKVQAAVSVTPTCWTLA